MYPGIGYIFVYNNFIFRHLFKGGGISNVAHLAMRSSFIVKPLSAIIESVGSGLGDQGTQILEWCVRLMLCHPMLMKENWSYHLVQFPQGI